MKSNEPGRETSERLISWQQVKPYSSLFNAGLTDETFDPERTWKREVRQAEVLAVGQAGEAIFRHSM